MDKITKQRAKHTIVFKVNGSFNIAPDSIVKITTPRLKPIRRLGQVFPSHSTIISREANMTK